MKIQSNAMDRIRQLNTRTLRETVGLQEVLVDPTKEKAAGRAADAADELAQRGIENRKRANAAAEATKQRLANQTANRQTFTGQKPRVLVNPAAVNASNKTSDQIKTGLNAVKTVVKDILAPPGQKLADKKEVDKKLPAGNSNSTKVEPTLDVNKPLPAGDNKSTRVEPNLDVNKKPESTTGSPSEKGTPFKKVLNPKDPSTELGSLRNKVNTATASSAEKEIPANNKTSPKLKRFGIGAGLAMMVPAAIELYQNRNKDKEKPADPEPATSTPTPPASAPTTPPAPAASAPATSTPPPPPPPPPAQVVKKEPPPPPPPPAQVVKKEPPNDTDYPGYSVGADKDKVRAFIDKAEKEKKDKAQRAQYSGQSASESVQSRARSASFVFERIRNITEGRPSQRHPLEGHDYHKKSNDELVYIAKDAHKAAEAMKGHNTKAENKYRDQANDSATVRYYRQKSGMPDWYKKKYGHMKEDVMEGSPAAKLRKDTGDTGDASRYPSGKPVIPGTDYLQSVKGVPLPDNDPRWKLPVPSNQPETKVLKPEPVDTWQPTKPPPGYKMNSYGDGYIHAKTGKPMKEAKEKTEYDYEGDMARGQLQSIISNAQRVHDMLEDNDNLAEWVQSKITLAEDYISTVANYMMSEVDEEVQQDLAEVSNKTLKSYQQKVSSDSMKHKADPTKRSPEKANRSVAGFAKAQNRSEQGVAEEVEVGDKVSFNHPMTAAPGKTMKKVGTVHKVEDDTVHVKVKSKYGVMTHKKSASELTKEEFNIDEEVEELDELNKDTLYSYSKKAEVDQDKQFTTIGKGMRDNEPKSANKAGHKFSMRSIGINRADKRLQKEEQIEELSSDLLGRYKKSAGEQASAADKSGDYAKGNKRFSGIMKATKKQFANDTKQGVAEGATGAKPGFMLRQDPDLAKKLKDQLARKKKLPQGADFAAQRRKERLASNGRMDEAVESHQEEWIDEAGPGLWANIHAKRQRIKQGSKERMRNPGEKGAPESGAFEKAGGTNEEVKGEYDRKVDKYLKKKYAPDDNKAPPFDAPYAKMPKADKSGAIHSPMSRAKHLAKMAGRKQAGIKENSHDGQDNINTPAKRSLSKTAGMVKTILKGAKSKNKNLDKFESEPELSSQIVKQE